MNALFHFFSSYSYVIYLVGQNAILALSIYITLMAGLLSLSCMGFMEIGAYGSALLVMRGGVGYPWSLLLAAILSGVVALVIARPIVRLKGVYLAITTVGFSELVSFVALNWHFTGGAMGLSGIPQLASTWQVFLFLMILIYGFHVLQRSRYGRGLLAIGRDETAARSMGIQTGRYKATAFIAGAMMASIAGSFDAHHSFYISPSNFGFSQAVLILLFAVFGGLRNFWGPILGATVLTVLPEAFQPLKHWETTIYGVSVLLVVIFFPGGLLDVGRLIGRRARKAEVQKVVCEGSFT